MRVCYTPEMRKLRKIFEPYTYIENMELKFREDTPPEAFKAFEEFHKIYDKIESEQEQWLYGE